MNFVLPTWTDLRRALGHSRRALFPPPEEAAFRHAERLAWQQGRHRPGVVRMMGYELAYRDLVSVLPQWQDVFQRHTLDFVPGTDAPRILEGGANVGIASLYWKRRFPRARITAFEADPELAACLRQNLANNGAADVEVVAAALWTANGTVSFRAEGSDSGAVASVAAENLPGELKTVPAVRLADLLDAEPGPVDLLKLDVEGAEGPLLEDCRGHLGRVRALALEIHDFDPNQRHAARQLQLLEDEGYELRLGELFQIPERVPAPDPQDPFPRWPATWVLSVRAFRRG